MHNGFITIDKEKMSKSPRNFFTIKEVTERYDPEVVRFFILSTHYRSPDRVLRRTAQGSRGFIDRYYTTLSRIGAFGARNEPGEKTSPLEKAFENVVYSFKEKFQAAMDDDLTPPLP